MRKKFFQFLQKRNKLMKPNQLKAQFFKDANEVK